jgi:hypothetical protein
MRVTYNGRLNRLRGKGSKLFVITTGVESPIPHVLGPGETWSGMVRQDQVVASMETPQTLVYLGVQHSMAEKPVLVRVEIQPGSV